MEQINVVITRVLMGIKTHVQNPPQNCYYCCTTRNCSGSRGAAQMITPKEITERWTNPDKLACVVRLFPGLGKHLSESRCQSL